MTARIGGIAAPYIALYLPHVNFEDDCNGEDAVGDDDNHNNTIQCSQVMKELPMLLMGGSALLGSILSLVLPETLGSALPARWQCLMDEVSQLLEFVIRDSKVLRPISFWKSGGDWTALSLFSNLYPSQDKITTF